MKKEEENTTKQTQGFDIILSRIIKIVSLCVVLFGVIFFIACKSFIPKYYYNKGKELMKYELTIYEVYELNGKLYSLNELKDASAINDMEFSAYIRKMKEKGLREVKEEGIREFLKADNSAIKVYYEKANQYWMIFSNKYYPGTEEVMESEEGTRIRTRNRTR